MRCRLEGGWGLRQWWNYLRRQLCVLDTYYNAHNRRTNHVMAVFHCWASLGFVLPLTTGAGATEGRMAAWRREGGGGAGGGGLTTGAGDGWLCIGAPGGVGGVGGGR